MSPKKESSDATLHRDILGEVVARNAKLYAMRLLGALVNAVEAMKRLRDEARGYFKMLKTEAGGSHGWKPGGGVEDDFIALEVVLRLAQLRTNLVGGLITYLYRNTAYVPRKKTDRLYKSNRLYYNEIDLLVSKAGLIIIDYYENAKEKPK
jgi:hypothetical protein